MLGASYDTLRVWRSIIIKCGIIVSIEWWNMNKWKHIVGRTFFLPPPPEKKMHSFDFKELAISKRVVHPLEEIKTKTKGFCFNINDFMLNLENQLYSQCTQWFNIWFFFFFFLTTLLSKWDFSHGIFRLPYLRKASCDWVTLPNLRCMLDVLVFPLSAEIWHALCDL